MQTKENVTHKSMSKNTLGNLFSVPDTVYIFNTGDDTAFDGLGAKGNTCGVVV